MELEKRIQKVRGFSIYVPLSHKLKKNNLIIHLSKNYPRFSVQPVYR